jgi:hypothetical protein
MLAEPFNSFVWQMFFFPSIIVILYTQLSHISTAVKPKAKMMSNLNSLSKYSNRPCPTSTEFYMVLIRDQKLWSEEVFEM